MTKDVILVDIIGLAIADMVVPGISAFYYEPGRAIQILQSLNEKDQAPSLKNKKYPLFAMIVPIREKRETTGHYATALIPRIVISTISNDTDTVLDRYKDGGTFKSVLYPCYYEFLRALARSPYIIGSDPTGFKHDKMDNPAVQPIGQGSSDYVDSIEIHNLEIILNQIKTC